jgi:hypothetical protein
MFTVGVPVFSTGHEDNTVLNAVEHGGLVFEFALMLTKVMVVSIHNKITSLLQETGVRVHQKRMRTATLNGERKEHVGSG